MTPSFGLGRWQLPAGSLAPGLVWASGRGYVRVKIAGKQGSGEAGRMPLPRFPASPLPRRRSATKSEQHHIAILHDVLLTLRPGETLLPGRLPTAYPDEVVVPHRLSPNESLLKIRVDHAGCDRRLVSPIDRPGADLLLARREVALETQEVIRRMGQPIQSGLGQAQRFQ